MFVCNARLFLSLMYACLLSIVNMVSGLLTQLVDFNDCLHRVQYHLIKKKNSTESWKSQLLSMVCINRRLAF